MTINLIIYLVLGYWFFHCHIEFHVEIGMALVFKFGEHEDMPPVPRDFPKCGNYEVGQHESFFEHLWSSWFSNNSNVSRIQIPIMFLALIFVKIIR